MLVLLDCFPQLASHAPLFVIDMVLDDLRTAILADLKNVSGNGAANGAIPGTFEAVQAEYASHLTYAKHRSLAYAPNQDSMAHITRFSMNTTVGTECSSNRLFLFASPPDWQRLFAVSPVVIHGESGCGKSSLLANWFLIEQAKVERLHAQFFAMSEEDRRKEIRSEFPPLLFAHFIGCAPEAADPVNIMRRLMSAVRVHFSLAMSLPDRDEDIARDFPHWLQAASERGRVVVLLDAVDQLVPSEDRGTLSRTSSSLLDDADQSSSKEEARLSSSVELSSKPTSADASARALAWLPSSLPASVNLVLSCSTGPILKYLLETRGWNRLNYALPALTPLQKTQLVDSYLQLHAKKLSASDQSLLTSAKLSSSPLFLRAIMDELRSSAVFENLTRQLTTYAAAPSIPDLFEAILARWERDYNAGGTNLVGRLLSCASVVPHLWSF